MVLSTNLSSSDFAELAEAATAVRVRIPKVGLAPGRYRITPWNTAEGRAGEALLAVAETEKAGLSFETPPFAADLALAIRRA